MFLAFLRCLKQQVSNNCDVYSTESMTPLHGSILIRYLMDFYEEFEKVNSFLENYKSLDINCKEFHYGCATLKNGMYLRALYEAIIEVENLYIEDFGKLERSLLFGVGSPELATTDPYLELGSSINFVSNVHSVYTQILRIIDSVVEFNLHGCQILDLCLRFKYFLPNNIFFLLLKYLNRPFLKQTASWIVFGNIEDGRDEFFIRHRYPEGFDVTSDTISTTMEKDSSNFSVATNIAETKEEIYEIENEFVPLHVPPSLACKILNTGKLMSFLRRTSIEASKAAEFENGDFGINENEILKIMKKIEKEDNYELSKVERVVNLVWNSVNKVK